MRLVYLNKVFVDSPLPAVNFSIANAYGLAEAGSETFLMVQKKSEKLTATKLLESFHLKPLPNFHIHLNLEKKVLGIKTNQWFYIKAFKEIKKLHQEKPIDAVISRDPGALPYLAKLKKIRGIKVFYQPHNFYVDLSRRPDVNPTNAKKYHLLEKNYISKIDGVLCLQEAQAELFRNEFPDQTVLVAKPGLLRIKPYAPAGFYRKLIGYVGSLQLKKGINTLLEAFKLVGKNEFKVILVGGRSQKEIAEVKQRIFELGLEDRVLITGWVSYEQVEVYLEKISVGIIPLTDEFYNQHLTAPNKFFDYLSHGIPVVASDLPSTRSFMNQNEGGLFVPTGDPEKLAQAIKVVFKTEDGYNTFRESAHAKAKDYLWKNQAKTMIELIREVVPK